MVGAERRVAAPHPGPLLKREYVDMLGLDVATFAAQLGMDASLLGAMLEGRASIDVVTAVRIARALQLPAERIMQMQLRHEFYSIRQSDAFQGADLVRPAAPVPFPDQHLCGHLGRSRDAAGADSLYFRESLARHAGGDTYAGLHALWPGDRMRVYDPAGAIVWIGPVLHDFDGNLLLAYVPRPTWHGWFAKAYRADLSMGLEHAAEVRRMRA
jgi:addiction module HigA family antidote